jgi:hypothetical protein
MGFKQFFITESPSLLVLSRGEKIPRIGGKSKITGQNLIDPGKTGPSTDDEENPLVSDYDLGPENATGTYRDHMMAHTDMMGVNRNNQVYFPIWDREENQIFMHRFGDGHSRGVKPQEMGMIERKKEAVMKVDHAPHVHTQIEDAEVIPYEESHG